MYVSPNKLTVLPKFFSESSRACRHTSTASVHTASEITLNPDDNDADNDNDDVAISPKVEPEITGWLLSKEEEEEEMILDGDAKIIELFPPLPLLLLLLEIIDARELDFLSNINRCLKGTSNTSKFPNDHIP
jgi:hypothetical protein